MPGSAFLEEIQEELNKTGTKKNVSPSQASKMEEKKSGSSMKYATRNNSDRMVIQKSSMGGKSPKFGARNAEDILDEAEEIDEGSIRNSDSDDDEEEEEEEGEESVSS